MGHFFRYGGVVDAKTIGARLQRTREQREISRQELAEALNMTRMQIGRIERGEQWLRMEYVDAVADKLRVTPAYLLCLDSSEVRESASQHEGRQAIQSDYDTPPGLRELTSHEELVKMLNITTEEWDALRGLSKAWADSQVVTQEGWVSILYALRAAAGATS